MRGEVDSLTSQRPGERVALDAALAWLDARPAPGATERLAPTAAAGRVLAAPVLYAADRPPFDMTIYDGFALRAQDSLGAGGYTPLPLRLVSTGPIEAGAACAVVAGEALPQGADAVLPVEAAEIAGGDLEVGEPVARGAGIARRGAVARAGETALPAGRRLDPHALALAASAGAREVETLRPPRVSLRIAGAKPPQAEALEGALAALVARDGGTPSGDKADIHLWIGRTGRGGDDDAAARIAAAGGRLAIAGLAFAPAATAGLGELGAATLILLPGAPYAALAGYEVLAGPLLRRFAGRPSRYPGAVARCALTRKVASPVGVAEFLPLAVEGERAKPLAVSPADGLAALAKADGFAIIPAGCEGFPEGATVEVALFRGG